jgi:CheY-like chemotaxis protein
MDHMMPGMDGIEATRIIREEIGTDYARAIPVIALTANAIVGNESMFLSRGFQAFISKPIDTSKLDFVLRKWVRDKELERELWGTDDNAALPEEDAPGSAGGGSALNGISISINGVEIDKALERFSGDETVLLDVLRSYAANTPPLLSRLEEALEEGNLDDYAIVVHGIKGSSYGIFADEAGKVAEALETASDAGNFDAVKAGHFGFVKLTEALIQDIREAVETSDPNAGKPAAAEPDPALLQELRDACKAYAMDRVDAVMDQLESKRYERGGKLIAWLRGQVTNMAFKEIAGGEWPDE